MLFAVAAFILLAFSMSDAQLCMHQLSEQLCGLSRENKIVMILSIWVPKNKDLPLTYIASCHSV